MKKITIILLPVVIVVLLLAFLFYRNKKTIVNTPAETTKASKEIELSPTEKPVVNLIPRADGHNLTLKITGIPTKFTTVDYELIYTAKDQDLEIEKGVSGTIKLTGSELEKDDLLLGTASCTNGCKYKYDEGVNGGTLTLTLTTADKQYVSYETPFTLKSATDLNKAKKLTLDQENLIINGTVASKTDYFVVIKNFNSVYSVFSSGNGKGKITSIEPSPVTKTDLTSIVGDYIAQ
ncbi:MAG: hypothetical protein PHE32_02170 [Candidatus Shapirobacteria bacterium]|nr:hypothetical protein [Candidatus Shapirobacteria bacterium]MDD4410476.1 hypothetical protein [Candidatus Shapirobacteria bacterium]